MARAAQVSIAMGLASFPMCFDLYTCLWFNELAVTTDVLPADVRTTLCQPRSRSSVVWSWFSLHEWTR